MHDKAKEIIKSLAPRINDELSINSKKALLKTKLENEKNH
jgi:hypothetical protein